METDIRLEKTLLAAEVMFNIRELETSKFKILGNLSVTKEGCLIWSDVEEVAVLTEKFKLTEVCRGIFNYKSLNAFKCEAYSNTSLELGVSLINKCIEDCNNLEDN